MARHLSVSMLCGGLKAVTGGLVPILCVDRPVLQGLARRV
jgi:hypothetical protein